MLKAGDWIKLSEPVMFGENKEYMFQKIKNVEHAKNDFNDYIYCGNYFDGTPFVLRNEDFSILTPEEVKAKGFDDTSNFVPQKPNDGVKTVSQSRNRKPKQPYTKFLFCEDGSVNTDSLKKDLRKRNPEIKVVVYRQGANAPQLVDIKEQK